MSSLHESGVIQACRVLFGDEVRLGLDFLYYLQPSGAKSAYRRRAKELHPDLDHGSSPETARQRAERFRELVAAHNLLNEFFRQREAGEWHPQRRPRRIPPRGPHAPRRPPPAPTAPPFQGQLPQIPLEIGRYCYYRGVVPYATLIEALAWQRRQRPLIGEIALRWGWLDKEGVRKIFGNAAGGRFGERAVSLGLLTPRQVRDLLYYQRARQQRLGRYFVERGFASEEEMQQLAEEMRRHNAAVATGARRNGASR